MGSCRWECPQLEFIPHSPIEAPLAVWVSNSPTILLQLSTMPSHTPIPANIIPPGFMICMPANRWEISKPFGSLSTRFHKPNIVVARSISLLDRWKYYCNSYRFFAAEKKQWIDEIHQKLGLQHRARAIIGAERYRRRRKAAPAMVANCAFGTISLFRGHRGKVLTVGAAVSTKFL